MIRVRVKPNSRQSALAQMADGTWLARVKSPPIQGRANHELIELVAECFGCAKGSVSIKRGPSSRLKLVRVDMGG
jgi:uncharacterized protein (TIGR00251 family)